MSSSSAPLFSLVMCTVNSEHRETEIKRLFNSLKNQIETDFEVVVVDQNTEFDLASLIEPFKDEIPIRHIRSARGLSRARNRGIEIARGKLCAFPDDDCWYAPDLLARVRDIFVCKADIAGVHGRGSDPETGLDMARFDSSHGQISLSNVLERSVSCALFYRTGLLREVGGFDEELGLGSGTRWTGCEDYELPIRLILAGHRLDYHPDVVTFHPCPSDEYNSKTIERAREQSPSFGMLLTFYPFGWFAAVYRVSRPLGGAVLSLLNGDLNRARYHLTASKGRFLGAFAGIGRRPKNFAALKETSQDC